MKLLPALTPATRSLLHYRVLSCWQYLYTKIQTVGKLNYEIWLCLKFKRVAVSNTWNQSLYATSKTSNTPNIMIVLSGSDLECANIIWEQFLDNSRPSVGQFLTSQKYSLTHYNRKTISKFKEKYPLGSHDSIHIIFKSKIYFFATPVT